MNREIKFKIWDPKNGIGEPTDISKFPHLLKRCYEYGLNPSEWTYLQYTGLKDKNGKEIYEGDIIKASYYYLGDNYFRENISEVKFGEGSYYLAHFNAPSIDLSNHLEIIGNIYENPELLDHE